MTGDRPIRIRRFIKEHPDWTFRRIAGEFLVHESTVQYHARTVGRRSPVHNDNTAWRAAYRKELWEAEKEGQRLRQELVEREWRKGKTSHSIAKELNLARSTVFKIVKRLRKSADEI